MSISIAFKVNSQLCVNGSLSLFSPDPIHSKDKIHTSFFYNTGLFHELLVSLPSFLSPLQLSTSLTSSQSIDTSA